MAAASGRIEQLQCGRESARAVLGVGARGAVCVHQTLQEAHAFAPVRLVEEGDRVWRVVRPRRATRSTRRRRRRRRLVSICSLYLLRARGIARAGAGGRGLAIIASSSWEVEPERVAPAIRTPVAVELNDRLHICRR